MTESEWLVSDDPGAMLELFRRTDGYPSHPPFPVLSDRKLTLWVEACREIVSSREKVETVWATIGSREGGPLQGFLETWSGSRYTYVLPLAERADLLRDILGNPYRPLRLSKNGRTPAQVEAARRTHSGCCSRHADNMACDCLAQAGEILGEWLTPTVTALARHIYDDRDWELMPQLGDALEDAGCDNADILTHLRAIRWVCCCGKPRDGSHDHNSCGPPIEEPAIHARGCWCLDLILGLE